MWDDSRGMKNRLEINCLCILILTCTLLVLGMIYQYRSQGDIKHFTIEEENGKQTINIEGNR